ncbi:unnamed protein product [Dovyalis caffra]|uniref:RRM domain-containing protein n=1 Tax=Dovyalis caffra TaxID=77055 RepID=A0AAV1S654_9ROSI|nr:unnamed protein product [Dovyalis caffra]
MTNEAAAAEEEAVIRIFVGGLGERVSSDDLHNIFSSNKSLGLGIQSMEIIRSKGRSFAYIDFLPSSNNSLLKLFNTGGKLRLENAKEHYLARMTREWAQDQEALLSTPSLHVNDDHAQDDPTNKKQPISGKPNGKQLLSENKQLRLFFPRLGKVQLKSIPFSGSGKHRYSFRRVEVPPLPKHFCDCEEHSGPPPPAKHRHIPTKEEQGAGLDEEELNLMSSVMNKLFQMENVSDNACHEVELDKQGDDSIKTNDNLPIEENEATEEDDDDLIINIASGAQEAILTDQKSRFNIRQTSKDELSQNGLKKQKRNTAPFNMKRKTDEITALREIELDKQPDDSITTNGSPPLEEKEGDIDEGDDNLIINMASGAQEAIVADQKSRFNSRQTSKDEPSKNVLKKQKRNTAPANKKRKSVLHEDNNTTEPMPAMPGGNGSLLGQQSKSDNASERLPGHSSSKEELSKSDNLPSSRDSENNNSLLQENQNDHFGSIKEVGGHAEAQSTKPDSASTKPGRGYAWLSKSSWTQLVAKNNSNAFSISQILPGVTFGNIEPSKPDGLEVTKSRKSTHDIFKKSNIDPTLDGTSDFGVRKERNLQNTVTMSQQIEVGNTEVSAPVVEKKSNSALKQTNLGDVSIGETCSFMRTAASVKEWSRAKAALSRSRKRKNNEK